MERHMLDISPLSRKAKEKIASDAKLTALSEIVTILKNMREEREKTEGNNKSIESFTEQNNIYQRLKELYEIYDTATLELEKMRSSIS